jgi:hypothetical protein
MNNDDPNETPKILTIIPLGYRARLYRGRVSQSRNPA